MSAEKLEYSVILADLEAKRAALDAAISQLRIVAGATGDAAPIGPHGGGGTHASLGGEIPAGAFLGKSIPEAAKLYLSIVKKKQTTREIADALVSGGVESTSSNFAGIVHAVLDRNRKAGGEFLKMGRSHWALAEWYPAAFRATAAERAKPKKKSKAKAKAKAKVASKSTTAPATPTAKQQESAPSAPAKGGSQERLLKLLRSRPSTPHTQEEIAADLGLGLKVVQLLLGKLVKAKLVGKTERNTFYPIADPKVAEMPKAV